MKREFLEGLGIAPDVIAKIMQENGADIENARATERAKYEAENAQLKGQVTDLQTQIQTRDTDLAGLNTQLAAAQADAGKLAEAQGKLAELQGKYDKDSKAWEAKTAKQAREYAIRVKAAEMQFSSASAKKAFIADAIADANIKQDGSQLLGYADFLANYRATDPGAFAAKKDPEPDPAPTIVLPGKSTPTGKKTMTLAEIMQKKNDDPNYIVDFGE